MIEGDIRVNGKLIKSISEIASISGYVQQDDLFIGSLTVKEHLIFQSMLRMDTKFSKNERLERVEQVMIDVSSNKLLHGYCYFFSNQNDQNQAESQKMSRHFDRKRAN